MKSIGIVGLGFVGNAMYESLKERVNNNITIKIYDKYKNGGIGILSDLSDTAIIFLCLPTPFNESTNTYDMKSTYEVVSSLNMLNYNGIIVIKSTVIPGFTSIIQMEYPNLIFIHNPEFLTARTAKIDIDNQKHIVIGGSNHYALNVISNFYSEYYPNANISICNSDESECMKIFCNSFYAIKIQALNEMYLLTQKLNLNYDTIKDLMLKNNWINPMHTNVPGPDGKLSYGGACFPKDTKALLSLMKDLDVPSAVLNSTVEEQKIFRSNDNVNIIAPSPHSVNKNWKLEI